MKIEIVTPYQHIVSDEAEEVYAYGPRGEFGILPGHVHYVTPLTIGRMYYRKEGKKHVFLIVGGFMEVFQDKVIVLADEVERPEQIDAAAAKAELEQIDRQLGQEELTPEEFEKRLKHLAKEQAKVQVALES